MTQQALFDDLVLDESSAPALPENYMARAACGCVDAIVSTDLDRETLALTLGEWILAGWSVEPATRQEACAALLAGMNCPHRDIPFTRVPADD